ncbi:MAG: hypothetical protein JF603_14465 [Acidobacteria bacterium]|nr:hypothetical protein [Acidobacteriota bacterium]
MPNRSWVPWLARVAWLSLPVTAGSVVADALAGRAPAVRLVAALLLWAGWAAVVLALLLPRPLGLVAIRVAAPAALAIAAWAAIDSGRGTLFVAPTAVVAIVAFLPETGRWLVNGTAYGDERLHLLRLPASLLAGPVELAGLLIPIAVLAGPLLLAARAWVAGAVALAAGLPLAVVLVRALHALTLRWLVMVPAGIVVKDHLVLGDPVLFRRTDVTSIRVAPADTDATDLTAGAFGLALELRLRSPVEVAVVTGRATTGVTELVAVLVTPTRPGAMLADAGAGRLPVG